MTPEDFRMQFPELSTVTDDSINYWVDKSSAVFNVDLWGQSYDAGLSNWVAHKIATQLKYSYDKDFLDPSDGLNIMMPRVGMAMNVNTRDLVLTQAKDPYIGTIYGQEYRRLSRLIGIGGVAG